MTARRLWRSIVQHPVAHRRGVALLSASPARSPESQSRGPLPRPSGASASGPGCGEPPDPIYSLSVLAPVDKRGDKVAGPCREPVAAEPVVKPGQATAGPCLACGDWRDAVSDRQQSAPRPVVLMSSGGAAPSTLMRVHQTSVASDGATQDRQPGAGFVGSLTGTGAWLAGGRRRRNREPRAAAVRRPTLLQQVFAFHRGSPTDEFVRMSIAGREVMYYGRALRSRSAVVASQTRGDSQRHRPRPAAPM